jgi:hypothetical protein
VKGVQYLVDDKGVKRAVVIDLKTHGKLWEDFQDILVARERVEAPRIPWEEVKAELRKQGTIK